MKTVIFHSADFDGQFCREIAKKFLGEQDVQYIGWNFGDPPLAFDTGTLYVMDLPCDRPFGFNFADVGPLRRTVGDENGIRLRDVTARELIWIDHHKSSIESHPSSIPGYRIDGVAACRLAWQWFQWQNTPQEHGVPTKEHFINRQVTEPLAVRLAGEYDIWDHRGDGDLELQFGLRSIVPSPYGWSLLLNPGPTGDEFTRRLIEAGAGIMTYNSNVDAGNMKASFLTEWEGLKFLCLNGRGNSNTFASRDVPETGHDALLMFYFQGKQWVVSLYHAAHRKDIDLSQIAVRHGGGGHRGACGFTCAKLPFLQ